MSFSVYGLPQSSISYLYATRDEIEMDPRYQRAGDVWNIRKRQLLIDSIINGYDVPKLYFHSLNESDDSFAVIDGKQRLQSIWGFMEGDFDLAEDFSFLKDEMVEMAGFSYKDLARHHPRTRAKFDSFVLPVFCIRTKDEDVIEEMFTRLNEGSPLNAAEKRNAFGGRIPQLIRDVSAHEFFRDRVSCSDSRYKYYDTACKMLYFEGISRVADTKRTHLDAFVRKFDDVGNSGIVLKILDEMCEVFGSGDSLLKSLGVIPLYYLLFRLGHRDSLSQIREKLECFEVLRKENQLKVRQQTGPDFDLFEGVDLDLLEFDRLRQSANDSSAIQYRCQFLAARCQIDGVTFERLNNFPSYC